MSDLAAVNLKLTEHLLRRSVKRVLDLIEKSLRVLIDTYLSGHIQWHRQSVDNLLHRAYQTGARHAIPMLPRVFGEAKYDDADTLAFLASLPGPERLAQSIQEDLDSSESTATAEARAEAAAIWEVSKAYHQGMNDVAASVIGHGIIVEKRWLADPDACEEICQPNAEDGWIPEDINFASGEDLPPGHPHCRCSAEYR